MKDPLSTPDEMPPADPVPRPTGFAREGETFQHYQVLRREDGSLWELGRGAMGITYKAFDTNLRCHVALKVISSEYLHSDTAGQRFVREARVAARLRHPHIASVYHLGVDPQGFFYSMEFIDGETLETLVGRVGPLPLETVLDIGLQVARALAAAARQGLIHRDIKPANLMVLHEDHDGEDRLFVKMIDFGLARSYSAEDSSPQLTATGFVGTPLYASPEQLEEQDLDVRSDIYSLGVTLWILLTGRPPFEGKMTQVITQHLHAPPPWWQLTHFPEPVRALLERTLHKNRLQRYQSAGELRLALESCLHAVSGRAERPAPAERAEHGAPEQGHPMSVPALVAPTNVGGRGMAVRRLLGTVTGRSGAVAKARVRPAADGRATGPFAGHRFSRLRSPLVVAPAVVLFVSVLIYWRAPIGTADAERSPSPSQTNTRAGAAPEASPTLPVPVAAEDAPTPPAGPTALAVSPTPSAPLNPSGNALEASAGIPATPETHPSPADPPPTSASPAGLDGLDGSPTITPETVAAATPTASSAASEEHANAADANANSPTKGQGNTTRGTHTHRSARPTPTPAPNFFQKLFGIKPKATPKSR